MRLEVHYNDHVRVTSGSHRNKVGVVIARRATIGRDWYCVKPKEGFCFIVHDWEIEKMDNV